MLTHYFFILIIGFLLSLVFSYIYLRYSSNLKILFVEPNYRSSHLHPTPTGAGIIFSIVFLGISSLFALKGAFDNNLIILSINMGGLLATFFGFYDDTFNSSAKFKLFVQIVLACWVFFIFRENIFPYIYENFGIVSPIAIIVIFFLLIWFSNAINFMDGINGMLGSTTVLIAISSSFLIFFSAGQLDNIILLTLLASTLIAFLVFNFTRGSIFMGDAGSLFIGYMLSTLMVKSVTNGELSFWTWAILLGHNFIEPTITTLIRITLTKNWYKPHRNCAYQNLSRKLGSHIKVAIGSINFFLFWLLPLAFLTVFFRDYALIIYLISILPVITITIKYGPLYSNTA